MKNSEPQQMLGNSISMKKKIKMAEKSVSLSIEIALSISEKWKFLYVKH
jgi:hypothetical protein